MMTDSIGKIPLGEIYQFCEVAVTAAPTERYGCFFSFMHFDILRKGMTPEASCTAIKVQNISKKTRWTV